MSSIKMEESDRRKPAGFAERNLVPGGGRDCETLFLKDGLTGIPGQSVYNVVFNVRVPTRRKSDIIIAANFVSFVKERFGERPSLAFVDFSGFKRINDELGHEYGDYVLSRFSSRLKSFNVLAFRRGGDEFVLVGKKRTIEEIERFFEESWEEVYGDSAMREKGIRTIPVFGIHEIDRFGFDEPKSIEDLKHFRSFMSFHLMVAETECYEKKRRVGLEER